MLKMAIFGVMKLMLKFCYPMLLMEKDATVISALERSRADTFRCAGHSNVFGKTDVIDINRGGPKPLLNCPKSDTTPLDYPLFIFVNDIKLDGPDTADLIAAQPLQVESLAATQQSKNS